MRQNILQPSKVVQAFHRYIQSEARDQRHTKKLLQHALDQNSDDVDVLNSRLDTIKVCMVLMLLDCSFLGLSVASFRGKN